MPPHQPNKHLGICALALGTVLLGACQSSTQTQPVSAEQPTQAPTVQDSASAAQATSESVSATTESSTAAARTDQENIEILDAELERSLGDFDGMILRERGKAEAAQAASAGDTSLPGDPDDAEELFEEADLYEGLPGYGEFPEGGDEGIAGDSGGEGDGEAGDRGGDESTAVATAEGNDTDGSTGSTSKQQGPPATSVGSAAAGPETSRPGGAPSDVQDGSDDDIVARQIREAALNEKDPILREKLWDEYRRYKRQK